MKRYLFDGFVVLCVSLFILYQAYIYKPGIIDTCVSYCVYPIILVQNKVTSPLRAYCLRRSMRHRLEKNYQELYKNYLDERAARLALQAQVDTYADIQEIQAFAQRYDVETMRCVQIVARNQTEAVQVVTVDAGSRHGIEPGMCAVYKNCLVGRVVEVFPFLSRVQLITDKHCTVPCVCSETKTRGICVGENTTDVLALNFVSHLELLREGDTVFTQGEGLVYPRGFAVGIIQSYQAGPLHYTVRLKPLVDFVSLEYCYILSKNA